jgi:hypothetical protein
MVIIDPLEIKSIKKWAKSVFIDVDMLSNGFAIDFINITFNKGFMHVADFDETPPHKLREGTFYAPETYSELLEKLIHHCGREKINKMLKDKITIIKDQQ